MLHVCYIKTLQSGVAQNFSGQIASIFIQILADSHRTLLFCLAGRVVTVLMLNNFIHFMARNVIILWFMPQRYINSGKFLFRHKRGRLLYSRGEHILKLVKERSLIIKKDI